MPRIVLFVAVALVSCAVGRTLGAPALHKRSAADGDLEFQLNPVAIAADEVS